MRGKTRMIKNRTSALAVFLLLLFPVAVFAADTGVRSRTFLLDRETVFEENILTLYEYVDLSTSDIAGQGISLHASGWGRYDFDSPDNGDRDDGELSYAYISVPFDMKYGKVNIGRQYVFAGVASEQIDGLSVDYSRSGFGVNIFGGSPPELDIDDRTGDSMYGGRLSHELPGIYEIGVSYLKEQNDSEDFREEYGVDVWLSPVPSLIEVQGISAYNEETSGWMEHSYRLTIGGYRPVRVYGEYSELDYEHFFQTATTAAFKTVLLTPDESYKATGGGIEVFSGPVQLIGRYKHFNYDQMGDADVYGGGITYSGNILSAGAFADRTDGDVDEVKYDMYRAFVSAVGEKLDLTLDYVLVAYDVEINGVDDTTAATGSLGYMPVKGLKTSVEATYSETPEFEKETRGMFKIDYRFGRL